MHGIFGSETFEMCFWVCFFLERTRFSSLQEFVGKPGFIVYKYYTVESRFMKQKKTTELSSFFYIKVLKEPAKIRQTNQNKILIVFVQILNSQIVTPIEYF